MKRLYRIYPFWLYVSSFLKWGWTIICHFKRVQCKRKKYIISIIIYLTMVSEMVPLNVMERKIISFLIKPATTQPCNLSLPSLSFFCECVTSHFWGNFVPKIYFWIEMWCDPLTEKALYQLVCNLFIYIILKLLCYIS